MYQTPWTKKNLPSDRIRPSHVQPATPRSSAKGKGKGTTQEIPKSREVQRLESLLSALRTSTGNDKDPKGGCFCQARHHSLSAYSPICHSCGLILCSINQPYHACPHCSTPVLTAVVRGSLMAQIETQIADTVAKETREREQAVEEVRKAAGAFPTLAGASAGLTGQHSAAPPVVGAPRPVNQAHKILSLDSKTKRVTVSSYPTTPIPSRPVSRAEPEEEEEEVRVPPPPAEVDFVRKPIDPARPWADLRGNGAKYVAPSRVDVEGNLNSTGTGRKRRRNKGKVEEPQSLNAGVGQKEVQLSNPQTVG